MKRIFLSLFLVLPAFAAVGDNAPGIPSTYVTGHPRLPAPSVADLNNIFTNISGGSSRYKTAADAFSINTISNGGVNDLENFRYTLVWYMACKQNSSACATAYGGGYQAGLLAKLVQVSHLNGLWGPLTYTASDGVVAGTSCTPGSSNCTLTSNSTNFLTACNGGSCTGTAIGVNGQTFSAGLVLTLAGGTNNQIALSASGGFPPNTGSGLDFGVTSTNSGKYLGEFAYCPLFDWINGDLNTTTQQLLLTAMKGWLIVGEAAYGNNSSGLSPFSDTFYTQSGTQFLGLMVAATVYPDDPNSIGHLRYWMDVFLNIWLPVFKLYGGQNCIAENDAGTASLTAIGGLSAGQIAAQPGCGLYWPEGWDGYIVNATFNMVTTLGPTYLSWATASGQMTLVNGIPKFFSDNGFLKNFMYGLMYKIRPDWVLDHLNAEGRGYAFPEYTSTIHGKNGPGTFGILATVYNDSTLRGFERCVNIGCGVPDGYESSGWPWYTPDSGSFTATGSPVAATNCSGKAGGPRCNLALTRDFPTGLVVMGTGWGENDTRCWISYMQGYWTHQEDSTGAWGCYSRGNLALTHAAYYRSGSASPHWKLWGTQKISFNGILFYDPSDYFSGEGVNVQNSAGTSSNIALPDTGSGRLPGSEIGNGIQTCGANTKTINQYLISPDDVSVWRRNYEFYHKAKRLAYQVGSSNKYTYVAIDLTDDYNNHFSANPYVNPCQYNTANSINHTQRVQKAVRQFLFIPDGTSAWVVIFDQLVSAPGNFANIVKKEVIHTINQPTIVGNSWSARRTEKVTQTPFQWTTQYASLLANCFSGGTPHACGVTGEQYQYNGKFLGWMTWAGPSSGSTGSLSNVGGAGNEFLIVDTGNSGTVNYNECMINQCVAPGEGVGSTTGFINPDPTTGPAEPGSWRIEEVTGASAGANNLEDYFVNVMRFTNNGDTETISTPPATSFGGGNFTVTWTVNPGGGSCAYTVTFPKYGIAPVATAVGAGCAATF